MAKGTSPFEWRLLWLLLLWCFFLGCAGEPKGQATPAPKNSQTSTSSSPGAATRPSSTSQNIPGIPPDYVYIVKAKLISRNKKTIADLEMKKVEVLGVDGDFYKVKAKVREEYLTGYVAIRHTYQSKAEALVARDELLASTKLDFKWHKSFKTCRRLSRKYQRPILINFTGSDWCPPCKQLQKNVFDTDVFKRYAQRNFILLKCDFPAKKRISKTQLAHNKKLAKMYGVKGYPTVIIESEDGELLVSTSGYLPGGPENYIRYLERKMNEY